MRSFGTFGPVVNSKEHYVVSRMEELTDYINRVKQGRYIVLSAPRQTGRGRTDIIISHNGKQYIIKTKIWRSERRYQAGKQKLAEYLKTERTNEGYYVVFDHRENPNPLV